MKLITNDVGVKPFKVLHNLPQVLEPIRKHLEGNVCILDLGNLTSFRKFMIDNTDYKHDNNNQSMMDSSWNGTSTWGDYLTLLDEGDAEVMKKMKVDTKLKIKELEKQYKDVVTNYKFDVTGQFFDVGLVLTGIPETWLEPEPAEEEEIKVDILLGASFSGNVKVNNVIKNASRVLAMVAILENHGVQVNLKMVNCAKIRLAKGNETFVSIISIKGYDEPINFNKLSSLITPAYLRRGIFKTYEVTYPENFDSGYGTPIALEAVNNLSSPSDIDALEHKLFGRK